MLGLIAVATLLTRTAATGGGDAAARAMGCDITVCAYHNGWIYKDIEGSTAFDETSIGCTQGDVSPPAGWQIAGDDADARTVASSYAWGTHCIAHNTNSGGTATSLGLGHNCWHRNLRVSAGRYSVVYCDARILVRTSVTTCEPGYVLDVPIGCLPLTGTALAGVAAPQLNISDAGGIIQFRVEVEPPPLTSERTNFSFAFDVGGTPKSEASYDCSRQWQQAGNNFTLELPYTALDGACHLNATHSADNNVREGFVSVFLLALDPGNGTVTDALEWHFPVTLKLATTWEAVLSGVAVSQAVSMPTHAVEFGPLRSQLDMFETNLFVKPKALALFHDGDRAFLSLTVGAEGAALEVSVQAAWLSQLPDPHAAVVHNLTDSVDVLNQTFGRIHLAVLLRTCVSCFLHVVGAVIMQENPGNGRLLASTRPHHVFHNLAVVVHPLDQYKGGKSGSIGGSVAEQTDSEGLATWLVSLAAAGSVGWLLCCLTVAVCVVKRARLRGAKRYSLEGFPEPDTAEQPELGNNNRLSCDMLDPAPALVTRQLEQVFDAATGVGGGRDVRVAGAHTKLRMVDAWEVKNPFLEGRYQAELTCRRWEAGRLAEIKFPGQGHVPYVPTTASLDQLRRAWGLEEACNEAILLHGTKVEHVLKIVQGGFNERLAGDERPGGVLFGNGNYFAEDAGKVDQYATPFTASSSAAGGSDVRAELYRKFGKEPPEQPVYFVVVCRVLLGLPLYTQDGEHPMLHPPTETGTDPSTSVFTSASRRELIAVPGVSPDTRYHALIAERGPRIARFREFVMFHGNAVLPTHIVAYSRE